MVTMTIVYLEGLSNDQCANIDLISNSLEYCSIMHIVKTHKRPSLIEKSSLTNLGIVTSSVYNDDAVCFDGYQAFRNCKKKTSSL